jgi:hypothetical protein
MVMVALVGIIFYHSSYSRKRTTGITLLQMEHKTVPDVQEIRMPGRRENICCSWNTSYSLLWLWNKDLCSAF